MKKLLLLFVLTLMSCDAPKQPSYIEGDSQRQGNKDIRYFKDTRTGLCFAERGYSDSYAFTCVPCDSVKKLLNK